MLEIMDLPSQVICVLGNDGTFRKANIGQEQILGWGADELIGQRVVDYIHPEDTEATVLEMNRLFSGGTVVTDFRNRCRRKQGDYRWMSWWSCAKDGFIYCIGTDIASAGVAESPSREQASEMIPQLVWITDPSGNAIYFNRRWYDFTGLKAEQSLGMAWTQGLHPDDQERVGRLWRKTLEVDRQYEAEARFRSASGVYRWFLNRATPMRDVHGEVIQWFGTSTDVHDYKILQEQMRLAKETAEARRHMKAQVLTNVTREIRAPVEALLSYVDLLRDNQDSVEDRLRLVERIRRKGEQLLQLIEEIPDLSPPSAKVGNGRGLSSCPALERTLPLEGVRILLTENQDDEGHLLSADLTRLGADWLSVRHSLEALDILSKRDVDVVLMDMETPSVEGLETTAKLRRMGFCKPIVSISSDFGSESMTRYLRAGCDVHLAKPVRKEELIAVVGRFVRPGGERRPPLRFYSQGEST